jgi:hypothetical protein
MTTINVSNVREGTNKYGNLQTTDGGKYMFPVAMNGVFQAGQSYDVPVKQETWKDKKTGQDEVKYIITGRPSSVGATAAQPAPRQAPAPAQSSRMAMCDKDVLITATALMKSFIETGKFGLTDMDVLMKACVPAARLMVKAASGTPKQAPDHAGTFTGGDQ